jgi:phage FluMu protein Com
MIQEAGTQHYLGVLCSRCKAEIPVPPRIAVQQLTSKSDQDTQPRGFSVRCKVCNEEAVYGVNQIQEFEGTPRTRIQVSNHLRKAQRDSKLSAEGGAHI